ncbi:putative plant self-incompatibility S1 [Helianthus anomalus]
MKFLSKGCFFLYLMLHFCIIVNGFNTPLTSKTPSSSKFFEPYRVYISDKDVNYVVFQCTIPTPWELRPGETFTWKFRRDFFGTNKYRCYFGWLYSGLWKIEMNVFDPDVAKMCGQNLFHMNRCYWLLTKDGMYFSNNNETFQNVEDDNWRFMYTWNHD